MEFVVLDRTTPASSKRTVTDQGFLLIRDCVLAKSGVFEYEARDFQPRMYNDRKPDDIIYVYRSVDTLMKAAPAFSGAPMTNDHPEPMLDATNTRVYQTGHVNGAVRIEDDPEELGEKRMVGDLMATQDQQIKDIQAGKAQISNGFYSKYDFTPGVSPTGKRYDCEQHTFKANHVAIVDAARCGPSCRVADAAPVPKDPKEEVPMSTVTINGVSYEASEQVVQAVAQLQAELAECKSKLPTEEDAAAAEAAKAEAEAQLAAMQEQVSNAEAMTTPEALDEAVEERAEVVDAARKLIPNFDHKGKSNDAIRLEVVKAKGGDIKNLDSKPKDYVAARFDALVGGAGTKPTLDSALGDMHKNRDSKRGDVDLMAARDAAIDKKRNAWKQPK